MKALTEKERRYANLLLLKSLGLTDKYQYELYRMAGYSAPTKNSAKVNATQTKKREKIQKYMESFRDILENTIDKKEVAEKLKEIIEDPESKEAIKGIKEYNNVMGNHAPKGLNVDFNSERSDVVDGIAE